MAKLLVFAFAVVLFQTTSVALASNISFSINVGGPSVVISQPPDFLYPAELGFGVAVGGPHDMFYLSGVYYLYRGNGWYRASAYGGNWIKMRHRELPPELRRHKIAEIRAYRDREYHTYKKDRSNYRGKSFRPGEESREEHREISAPEHEGRRDMREQRHDDRDGERRGHGHDR